MTKRKKQPGPHPQPLDCVRLRRPNNRRGERRTQRKVLPSPIIGTPEANAVEGLGVRAVFGLASTFSV